MPPEGNELASGSPLTSSLPLNSVMALPSPVGRQEAVVLLGGQAGHRLEQVREVRGALFDRPVLHGGGDGVGDGRIERSALLDGLLEGLEDRLGQPFALHGFVEDVDAEQVLDVRFLEIDALELVLGGGDRFDGGVPRVQGAHTAFLQQRGMRILGVQRLREPGRVGELALESASDVDIDRGVRRGRLAGGLGCVEARISARRHTQA